MILEDTFRFKLFFSNCESYDDVFAALKWVEDHFKTLESLDVRKTGDGFEDDYHHLVIETEDPEKIKKLKDMGFRELEDEAIE
jgi:hypothetical protein|tara:strand:- start:1193 stop:1441 length:249 start_codon:yes stop_codon:yes gene_type:complete